MCGLIKKDLLMIKQNIKLLILAFVLFLGMTITNNSDMTFLLPFMAVMTSITTFSYDRFNKWDIYAIAFPNGRKNIVRAKYISTLILIAISFIVSYIPLLIINICGISIDLNSSVSELIWCLLAIILIMAIIIPVIYKFGIEKARIALFLMAFLLSGIIFLIVKIVHIDIPENIIDFFNNYYKILIPVIACLLIFISYKISERLYLKLDF